MSTAISDDEANAYARYSNSPSELFKLKKVGHALQLSRDELSNNRRTRSALLRTRETGMNHAVTRKWVKLIRKVDKRSALVVLARDLVSLGYFFGLVYLNFQFVSIHQN